MAIAGWFSHETTLSHVGSVAPHVGWPDRSGRLSKGLRPRGRVGVEKSCSCPRPLLVGDTGRRCWRAVSYLGLPEEGVATGDGMFIGGGAANLLRFCLNAVGESTREHHGPGWAGPFEGACRAGKKTAEKAEQEKAGAAAAAASVLLTNFWKVRLGRVKGLFFHAPQKAHVD